MGGIGGWWHAFRVDEAGPIGIAVERFDSVSRYPQRFALKRELMPAGAADAENRGGNRLRFRATDVRRFSQWLHPKMEIDVSRPVVVEVVENEVDPATLSEREVGSRTLTVPARPSLADVLEYLGDRRDYGLIYHARVTVDLR